MKILTAKEEEIMYIIWRKGPIFVKDILPLCKGRHFNTISTIVRSLEQKGYLSHKVLGNTYQYYAMINEEEYCRNILMNIIKKYFDNSCLKAVSLMIKEGKITVQELNALIDCM